VIECVAKTEKPLKGFYTLSNDKRVKTALRLLYIDVAKLYNDINLMTTSTEGHSNSFFQRRAGGKSGPKNVMFRSNSNRKSKEENMK
jgi:hypothetical protein